MGSWSRLGQIAVWCQCEPLGQHCSRIIWYRMVNPHPYRSRDLQCLLSLLLGWTYSPWPLADLKYLECLPLLLSFLVRLSVLSAVSTSPLVPLIWYPTSSLNMFIDPHIAAMCIGYLPCLPGAGTSRLTPHSFIKYLAIAHLMDLLVPTVNGVVWCGVVWLAGATVNLDLMDLLVSTVVVWLWVLPLN